MSINYFMYSPLEQFEVINLIGIISPIFNINITITNLGVFTVLATGLLGALHSTITAGVNNLNLIPLVQSRVSIFIETIYHTLLTIVREQIGRANEIYLPFIYALFTFILCTNLIGNCPYTFSVTSSAVVSIGLSLIIWLGVTLNSIDIHRLHFFSFFVPQGCPGILVPVLVPIELISYLARAVSLGVRLVANISAGHLLINILSTFLYKGITSSVLLFFVCLIPFALFLGIIALEIAVSFIQAYVITILTCIYIRDSISLH